MHLYTDASDIAIGAVLMQEFEDGRLARWLEVAHQFALELHHIPGKENVVADALSRCKAASPLPTSSKPTAVDDGAPAAADQEPEAAPSAPAVSHQHFGAGLRQHLLMEHHDVTLAGHFGRDKAVERLTRAFYWPGLRSHVADYTDGQTESVHRTLEEMLRHYLAADHSDWDLLLPCTMFAYNDAVHSSTGLTLFEVVYGRRQLTPAALLAKPPARPNADSMHSVNAVAELTVQRTREALHRARDALEAAAARQKRYANTHRRDWGFKRGDQVWLSTSNLRFSASGTKKLDHLRCGPFPVTKLISPVAVRLALPPHMRMHNVFQVSLLTPFEESVLFSEPPSAQRYLPPEHAEQGWYGISRFVAKRGQGPTLQFCLRWQGYGPGEDTWEPADQLRSDLGKRTINAFVQELSASAADDDEAAEAAPAPKRRSPPLRKPVRPQAAAPAHPTPPPTPPPAPLPPRPPPDKLRQAFKFAKRVMTFWLPDSPTSWRFRVPFVLIALFGAHLSFVGGAPINGAVLTVCSLIVLVYGAPTGQ
ncbi:hypothetical protein ABPG77_007955 [Micractinium sp. CCAP 211/92]